MKRRFLFRRPDLFFFGCCALVLAAGSAAVFAAIFAAPERAVDSHSALPVRSVLSAEEANTLFWPEQLWEEDGFSPAGQAEASLVSPWTQVLTGGWRPGEEQEAQPGHLFFATADEDLCFFLRDVWFTARPALVSGLPTDRFYPHPLSAQLAVGRRSGVPGVVCRVFAREGYDELPDDWQETAVKRCREELLYLFNLSNDDQRVLLYYQLEDLLNRRPWQLEGAQFPASEFSEYWALEGKERMGNMLETLRWKVNNCQYVSLLLYNDRGVEGQLEMVGNFYKHVPLYADPMPGQEEMDRVLADQELDVQIIPLEKQVMILFGWNGGNLAVYYDPVLDCFSGFALQG